MTHRLLNVSAVAIAIASVIVPPNLRAQQPEIAIAVAFTEGPTVDREGNVYFTEMVAQRIMKLSAKGVLTTFRENSNGAKRHWSASLHQGTMRPCRRRLG